MSEAEPIPPTSSVTALRIPMIKKGEYDLWSMKMRQYIAITDHILWDIITNGDQATTDPASSSAPKTSLAANARRNNEKALNILLSAIPDRHLLSFHDAANNLRFFISNCKLNATTLRLKRDLITLRIVPRLRSSGPMIGFVLTLAFTCLLGTKLSTLEALKGFILKIPGAITLSLFTTVDSPEEGTEFKVTGFDKAFISPTLGKFVDLVFETKDQGYLIHMEYPYFYPFDLSTELATV
ncbi:hypothetical protein Tco_0524734 [Tanacetum coccineum]